MFEYRKVSIDEYFEFNLLKQDRNFFKNLYLTLSTVFTILLFAIDHLDCLINQNYHITEKIKKFLI